MIQKDVFFTNAVKQRLTMVVKLLKIVVVVVQPLSHVQLFTTCL